MEELYRLSAGRWDILVSEVEPGSVEHDQGATLAVSVCCDGKPFTAYAYVERRHGEGCWTEDSPPLTEEPDFVGFVLSRRDIQKLEFLLARVHELLRGGNSNPDTASCDCPLASPGKSHLETGVGLGGRGRSQSARDKGEESR